MTTDRRPVRTYPGAVEFSKTIAESDVLLFAGITGDLHPIHIDAQYAATQPVGERIAHGIFVQGLMSTACTRWAQKEGLDILSYGWDSVRFIKPVKFGDTITVAYAAETADQQDRKRFSLADAHNQHGELVAVGRHLLYAV